MVRVAIFGATGTIGSTLARQLSKRGDQLVLLGRDREKLAQLSEELDQPASVVDMSRSESVLEAVQQSEKEHGPIEGLVNCVGSILLKPAHATSDEEFRETLETNLFSSFAVVSAGAKVLRKQGGSIVLFASAAAEIGIANHEAIAAAKGGIIGLARSAAATYASQNIRVNVISPGLIQTELTRRIWESPLAATASTKMHALGRLGTPEQVSDLAAWLLDPEHDFMTGQVLGIDGGLGHVVPKR